MAHLHKLANTVVSCHNEDLAGQWLRQFSVPRETSIELSSVFHGCRLASESSKRSGLEANQLRLHGKYEWQKSTKIVQSCSFVEETELQFRQMSRQFAKSQRNERAPESVGKSGVMGFHGRNSIYGRADGNREFPLFHFDKPFCIDQLFPRYPDKLSCFQSRFRAIFLCMPALWTRSNSGREERHQVDRQKMCRGNSCRKCPVTVISFPCLISNV